MMQYNSILAFGDSHVAGCELLGQDLVNEYIRGKITLDHMDSQTKPFAFPSIIAEMLGKDCYNYACSGGSNQRSLRLLPAAVKSHPDSLLLFFHTEPHRAEIYYPDRGDFYARDNDNYIQLGIQWSGVQYRDNYKTHPINEYYVKNMVRLHSDTIQTDNTIFYIDQVCKNLAADWLHIFGFPHLYDKRKYINHTKIFHEDFTSCCLEAKFEKLPLGHFVKDAHKAFADLILNKLSE